MRRPAAVAIGLSICLAPSASPGFIAGILACEFDPTSTACIARQISLLQRAEKPGTLKDRASAFLSYTWARRGQELYSRAMEKAPKDRRLRAYAATMARAELGDFKTARKASGYIGFRALRVEAAWIYGMAAVRQGVAAEGDLALDDLRQTAVKLKSPVGALLAYCRAAMLAAALGKKDEAREALSTARKVTANRLPAGAGDTPLMITCTAGMAAVEGRAKAVSYLSGQVARLQKDAAMPIRFKLVFLAQAAEQWTRLGDGKKSQALARQVVGAMAPLPAAQRLAIFRLLFFASFRPKPAK